MKHDLSRTARRVLRVTQEAWQLRTRSRVRHSSHARALVRIARSAASRARAGAFRRYVPKARTGARARPTPRLANATTRRR